MPTLTIFAGVNGAGKSTLYKYYSNLGKTDFGERINADEMLRNFGGDWKNPNHNLKAGIMCIKKIHECLQQKRSFNWETTIMSHFAIKYITMAKELGYTVDVNFVGVNSAQTAIQRVNSRVVAGGHGIPEDLIKQRYANQFVTLSKVLPIIDNAFFFDNSSTFKIVATYSNPELTFIDENIIWAKNLTFCYKEMQQQIIEGKQ